MKFYCFLQGAWYGRAKPISQLYREVIAEAEYAEELGYDGVWLAEQNFVTSLATPDPLQFAAIIGQRTKKIRIGLAVIVLPFHHPLRLAGEIAQLDVLINGRLDLGVGRGASPFQMKKLQRDMDEETSRRFFKEHLHIMLQHWAVNDRDQAFDGEFFKYSNVTLLPSPVQRPSPALWIAALSPSSTEWAVKLGLNSNHFNAPFREPVSWIARVYESFERSLKEVGRLRSASEFSVNRMTCVANTADEAMEVLPLVQKNHRLVAQQVVLRKEIVKDGEYDTRGAVPNEPSLEEMYRNTLTGTPDEVYKKVKEYYDIGVDQISVWHHLGQPHEHVKRSMRLFAEHIMPDFRQDRRKAEMGLTG